MAQHPSRKKVTTIPEIARMNIPIESPDRVEVIRGPMSVIYGNNAFLGVINVVTNAVGQSGPRVSASMGSRDSGRLFACAGKVADDGFVVLNTGAYRTDGLAGAYADMMDAEQLGGLTPGMHSSMDGDMGQRDLSLDVSAGWHDVTADIRYSQKDCGIYAFTPSFAQGSQLHLTTWQTALGWEHRFTDNLGLRASGVYSEERYDVDEFDFIAPDFGGSQEQRSRRWDLELDLYCDPRPDLSLLAGYRFRRVEGVQNRADLVPLVNVLDRLDPVGVHDLFAEVGFNLADPLRLVGGFRLSRLPKTYEYSRVDLSSGTRTDTELEVDDRDLLTGRIAALWKLDTHQLIKLIWGTAAQDSDRREFSTPERIETIEANYMQTRPGWTLSASLFRNRISNIVRTIQKIDVDTGVYEPISDNSGEWVTNGIELIGEMRPLPSLNLELSATWQHTEDRKSSIDPGYSPGLLAKLKADYRRGPMTYAAYAHYVSGMDADWDFVAGAAPGLTERIGDAVDGYWNVGMNLRYQPRQRGFYLNLNVTNLFAKEIRYPANELTDFARGMIGPRQVFTATVGYEF